MKKSVAILLDADNIAAQYFNAIKTRAQAAGRITHKRAFGNFCQGQAKSWLETLAQESFTLQMTPIVGAQKNAADIALAIDATELLNSAHIHTFCLVSSDSDFTPLANHIQNKGKQVIGIGEAKTSLSFQNACNSFHILKNHNTSFDNQSPNLAAFNMVMQTLQDLNTQAAWVSFSALGNQLQQNSPDFKYQELGAKTLKSMLETIAQLNLIELNEKNGVKFLNHRQNNGNPRKT